MADTSKHLADQAAADTDQVGCRAAAWAPGQPLGLAGVAC